MCVGASRSGLSWRAGRASSLFESAASKVHALIIHLSSIDLPQSDLSAMQYIRCVVWRFGPNHQSIPSAAAVSVYLFIPMPNQISSSRGHPVRQEPTNDMMGQPA
jgi:hypothetical protein